MELPQGRGLTRKIFKEGRKRVIRLHRKPIHWQDAAGRWHDLNLTPALRQDAYVIADAAYTLRVPVNSISFQYTHKLTGNTMISRLVAVDGRSLTDIPAPQVQRGRLTWKNLVPELDIYLDIRAEGVEWFKVIHAETGPRSFLWEVQHSASMPEECLNLVSSGWDAQKRALHMTSQVSNKVYRGDQVHFQFRETFENEVSVIAHRRTRQRRWDPDVRYPLLIDVPDVTDPISDTDDDVISFTNSPGLYNAGQYVGGFLLAGRYNYANTKVQTGLRFQGLAIPQGTQIALAELKLYQHDVNSGNVVVNWFGAAVDSAAAWSSGNLPRNIPKTTASAPAVIGTDGTVVAQDVTSIVQEIVNRPGWSSGNSMAFLAEVSTATGSGNRGIFWHDFSTTDSVEPVLEVTFFATDEFEATIAQALPLLSQQASGISAKPIFTAAVQQALFLPSQQASGTSEKPEFEAAITQALPFPGQSLAGSTSTFIANITQALPFLRQRLTNIPTVTKADAPLTWPLTCPLSWPLADFHHIQR